MNHVNELRKRTNPVFNTAKTTLYTLALAGEEYRIIGKGQ